MTFSVLVAEMPLQAKNSDVISDGLMSANLAPFDSYEHRYTATSDFDTAAPLHPIIRRTSSASTSHSRSRSGPNERTTSTLGRRAQPLLQEEGSVIDVLSSDEETAQGLLPTAFAKRKVVDEIIEAEDEAVLSVEDDRPSPAIEASGEAM